MRTAPLLIAAALAVGSPVRAGFIEGYVPGDPVSQATFDRFAGGFPAAPVPNPSPLFVAAGADLSGIGWRTDAPFLAVSLVSPRHVIGAAHVGLGGSVSFTNAAGQVQTFAVQSTTRLTTTFTDPATGATRTLPSDILVGTLATAVPASSGITPLAIAAGPPAAFTGRSLLLYGQNGEYVVNATNNPNPHLGTNTFDAVDLASFDNFASEATVVSLYDFDPGVRGEFYLIGGDSGGPALTQLGGRLALLGDHYGVSNPTNRPNPGDVSASTFLPLYLDQLAAEVGRTGDRLTVAAVPEPASGVLLAGMAAGLWAVRRKKKAHG